MYIMDLEAHVQLKMKENVFLSRQAKDLVCKLIVADPDKRLSAKQALVEPWFEQRITRESCSLLNKAQSSLKERQLRKSLGIQHEFERMPIWVMRMTELLKSGIDYNATQLKRSTSLSDPNNHYFASMQKQILDHGGRVRMGSYAMLSTIKKVNQPVEETSSSPKSDSNV